MTRRATGDRRHLMDAYRTLMRSFVQLKTLVLVESPEAEVFRALAEAGCRVRNLLYCSA